MADLTKIGVAAAKAMEAAEDFIERGWIPEGAYVGAAYLVVVFDHPTPDDYPDRELARDVTTQCFVWGVPEEVYVQEGVLRMGLGNTLRDDKWDEDET